MERRTKRSTDRDEALQFLVEAVRDRSDVHAVALIDEGGRIVAGTGMLTDLKGLAQIAGTAVGGQRSPAFDEVTVGTDVMARAIHGGNTTLYLAALGTRVAKMPDAARAVSRIVAAAN